MFQDVMHLLTKEYSLVLATTQKDFQAVKEVRNEVFSHRYAIYPELKEAKWYLFNQDDKQSFIYLLQHNATKRYVGTIRVFFINTHTPVQKMPMERDGHVEDIEYFTKDLPICEVSRLVLSNTLPEHKDLSALKLRTYLTVGLMSTIGMNIFLYKYTNIFSMIEPSLHRILKRQGVNFNSIGKAIDYYGIRKPYMIKREKLISESKNILGEITLFYLKELCQNPEKFWQFIDNNPYLQHSDILLDRICQLFEKHGDDVDIALLLQDQKIN
jgi:N-acyl amino acid synthase of PEP-CTERM/exosortase system